MEKPNTDPSELSRKVTLSEQIQDIARQIAEIEEQFDLTGSQVDRHTQLKQELERLQRLSADDVEAVQSDVIR